MALADSQAYDTASKFRTRVEMANSDKGPRNSPAVLIPTVNVLYYSP